MKGQQVVAIRAALNLLALAAAAGGGLYAYRESSSWWLTVFVAAMVLYAVGRAVPDLITDPEKVRRALFFGIPLATAVGWLTLAEWLWGTWWLAVVTGFAAGMLGWLVSFLSFPDIAQEEEQDNLERAGARPPQHETGGAIGINRTKLPAGLRR